MSVSRITIACCVAAVALRAATDAKAAYQPVSLDSAIQAIEQASFRGRIEPAVPPEYSAYVGHFENNGVEGPLVRVFVRNGRLWIDFGFEDLKPKALQATDHAGEFRIAEPDYNPALLRFDTVIEGHALRLEFIGVPLYRKDTP